MGKIFSIIWKAFCLMQFFSKNLKANLLRMQGITYINMSDNTFEIIYPKSYFHSSVKTHLKLHACKAGLDNLV